MLIYENYIFAPVSVFDSRQAKKFPPVSPVCISATFLCTARREFIGDASKRSEIMDNMTPIYIYVCVLFFRKKKHTHILFINSVVTAICQVAIVAREHFYRAIFYKGWLVPDARTFSVVSRWP